MTALVLKQSPDGVWYAEPVGGGDRTDNVGGWDGIQELLSRHAIAPRTG